MGRPGFIYDQSGCIGCNACQMACKDKNNLEVGIFCRRADTIPITENGRIGWAHFSGACNHCEKAACIKACPTGAMHKSPEGLVLADGNRCIGCGACRKACPYGAVAVSSRTGKAVKCDGCRDLLALGQKPACVNACLTHCLDFQDLSSAEEKEGYVSTLSILPDASVTEPSLLIRPKTSFPELPGDSASGSSAVSSFPAVKENEAPRFLVNPGTARSKDGKSFVESKAETFFKDSKTEKNLTDSKTEKAFGAASTDAHTVSALESGRKNPFTSTEAAQEFQTALSLGTRFFASYKEAYACVRDQLTEQGRIFSESSFSSSYDALFRGTDANRILPIWASAAAGEQVLLNQLTLEIIRFYHRFGYQPIRIEGNPPDYIGEQFRFLTYLASCLGAASLADATPEEKELPEAIPAFLSAYTLPTLGAILQALEPEDEMEVWISDWLKKLVRDLSQKITAAYISCSSDGDSSDGDSSDGDSSDGDPSDGDSSDNNSMKQTEFFHKTSPASRLSPPIADEEAHTIHTAGLNNCGGICVICPRMQEGCMLSISSDQSRNAPQLRACVRGRGYRKTFLNPGRLRYPMKRVGERGSGRFQRISWEEAIDLLASEWIRIRELYGPGSRYVLYGTGVEGIMRPSRLMQRLLALDGGYLGFFNSYSSACVNYVSKYIFGSMLAGHSAADFLNTKLLILWADNTAESIFGPERNYYLAELKRKGVKIICIDPRLSQTGVTYADEWYAIRPSTDAALADAMAYVIWSEGLQDQSFMDRYCLGFDEDHMPEGVPEGESYHSYLFGVRDGIAKTPEWAEEITGIEADRIRHLARLYATTKPACLACGLGAQRHGNGEQTARGTAMLAALTGNIGISGGGTGGNESFFAEHADIDLFPDQAENPYKGEIPTFLWTKAIEHGTELTPRGDRIRGVDHLSSNIKMIFCIASDVLINQHSNINDTIRILKDTSKCEFIVCSDVFMTPSARYADLILPATSVFEGENIVHSWAGSNYLLKNNQVLTPLFGSRFEWDWMKELAAKLGLYEEFIDGKPEVAEWLRESYELLRTREPGLPDYETFSREGGWQFRDPVNFVAFRQEIEDPEHHPFPTPSGKIEIFSKRLYDFDQLSVIPAIPKYVPCPEGPQDRLKEKYPLSLIGWHTRRRCHSIHDNNEWQDEVEMPGLWIHPEDAAARDIRNGDLVAVFNDRGTVHIPAVVTNRICKGVTAMSQGAWYTPDKEGVDQRGSINVLTSSRPTPLAKGNPQHTNLVEVRKL